MSSTTFELKGGHITSDRRLDRLPEKDPASRRFGITTVLPTAQPLRSYTWSCLDILDQGREGACVGFAFTHELIARPVVWSPAAGQGAPYARGVYFGAQRRDPWDGGAWEGASPFYEGTSVLAGAKELHARGLYSAYHWAFSEHELALGVGYRGPAVIGVDWYEGMFRPGVDGYIRPTGDLVGGHAILVRGFNLRKGYLLHNSWGPRWGLGGTCWVTREDMARLLRQGGECCLPTRAAVPSN